MEHENFAWPGEAIWLSQASKAKLACTSPEEVRQQIETSKLAPYPRSSSKTTQSLVKKPSNP
jgi:hypothetical protein